MRKLCSAMLLLLLASACGGSGNRPAANESPARAPGTAGATSTATATAAARDGAQRKCSVGTLKNRGPDPQEIPADVKSVRKKIIQAAGRCDYDALRTLAQEGDGSFSYSFGESTDRAEGDPGRYWRDLEDDDQPVLATLVRVLRLAPGKTSVEGDDLFVWPAAAAGDASEKDREAVEGAFKDENVDEWFTDDGYLGPRAGITADGDWIFFVSGGD